MRNVRTMKTEEVSLMYRFSAREEDNKSFFVSGLYNATT